MSATPRTPFSRRAFTGALLAAPLALAACGTTEPAQSGGGGAAGGKASGGAEEIVVTDVTGKEITLPAPASKVVALEWMNVEDCLVAGVEPIGVSDLEGYNSWVKSAPLATEPTDVGMRTEPSVERVAELEPDLILGIAGSVPEAAQTQMAKIAPIVLLNPADASDPLGRMRENTVTTGKLLGHEADSQAAVDAFDAHMATAKEKLAASGGADAPFVFVYIYLAGNDVSVRMHGPRSLPGAVAAEIGLKNAWEDPGDDAYGLSTTDLEGLLALPADTRMVYWANTGEGDPTEQLADNAVWQRIPPVQSKQVSPIADGVWMYGGPLSMTAWTDALVEALG
ncbi:ABC transporter substrate-binding protein [Propionibacteriaceae bacterium Y2011]|uniref:ABC transporter substrate-binding protein n=1 Tax=Microlunatus sp. Y2014 TaxID=3418488 RepID=UPI003B47F2EA